MDNITLQQYIGEIGSALSQLGNELQKQAQPNQPLNIHCQVKQTMDKFTYYLHNLNADLDACRYNLIKDGKKRSQHIRNGIAESHITSSAEWRELHP